MRDSRGLGLDEEMLVPVTVAECAGLDGKDVIKTANYPPLGLIFNKIGIYPVSSPCMSFLADSQHLSLSGQVSKQLISIRQRHLQSRSLQSQTLCSDQDATALSTKFECCVSAAMNLSAVFSCRFRAYLWWVGYICLPHFFEWNRWEEEAKINL